MIKDFKLLEHILIPVALFAINLSTVHLIYLSFMEKLFSASGAPVAICTALLLAGIVRKDKFLMLPAAILYTCLLVLSV
ncbi:hypothetical protein GZH53_13630 [Flavihumibacter sp. R14]|nr:hypothetical protein [Flavihumibacter soli]